MNIWIVITSISNIDMADAATKDPVENAKKWANQGLVEFHKNLPYIFKLVPTIIILYFYFR